MFLPSLAGGGAESASLRIATALVDRGHQVDLLTARVDQAPNNRPDERLRYSTFGRRHTRSAIRQLAGHLRTTRPDVLVTAMDPANVAGLVAARLSGTRVPVVVTFHSDVVAASRRSRRLFSHVRPAVARWTIRRADHVVAISKGVRGSLDELAPSSGAKVTTIYNPTVHDGIFALAAEPVSGPDGVDLAETVLAVGRLAPVKGFDVLVRAFARVVQEHPDMHLVIAGEGPLRGELGALAMSLDIADRVHLPGYVVNPYQYMARCRIFALSSRWEGLPTVLVEAGVLGCTIVATDCPSGPRELLAGRAQATLVPVDDPDALASAIIAALPRSRQVSVGDWHQHTMVESGRRYERVLLDVVSRAGQPPG